MSKVSVVYFRHPIISAENFKKEEKKIKKFNYYLKSPNKNTEICSSIYNELSQSSDTVPHTYACCSMEITTFKGCKFIRFHDIDVVPYYLLNLTKHNIILKQQGIYEHSEIIHKIPKEKRNASFEYLFKHYAYNFSFYNPYKDPKLIVQILYFHFKIDKDNMDKKKNRQKKEMKMDPQKEKYMKSNIMKNNPQTEKLQLKKKKNILNTNYITVQERLKYVNNKIINKANVKNTKCNLNEEVINVIDFRDTQNMVVLKLLHMYEFVYILVTKKSLNGKTLLCFEPYDDLINSIFNLSKITITSKHEHNIFKVLNKFSTKLEGTISRVYNSSTKMIWNNKKKNEFKKDEKKKKKSRVTNTGNLIKFLKKKEPVTFNDKNMKTGNLFTELYQTNVMKKKQNKKKQIELNLNVFMHYIFSGVGLSVSNQHLEEILYFSMENLTILYQLRNEANVLHVNLGWLQMDNHAKNSDYQNVILPIVENETNDENTDIRNCSNYEFLCENQNVVTDAHWKKKMGSGIYKRDTMMRKCSISDKRNEQKKYLQEDNRRLSHYDICSISNENENICKENDNNVYKTYNNSTNKKDSFLINRNYTLQNRKTQIFFTNTGKYSLAHLFSSDYFSVFSTTIIKKKRGNMKNFLELSDVSIKVAPMNLNIDSYFILELLRIIDELFKILEIDLNNYSSLNLEKNIEIKDNDFDSIEYKRDLGPLEGLIKYHIIEDYYLYEQVANFKFNMNCDLLRSYEKEEALLQQWKGIIDSQKNASQSSLHSKEYRKIVTNQNMLEDKEKKNQKKNIMPFKNKNSKCKESNEMNRLKKMYHTETVVGNENKNSSSSTSSVNFEENKKDYVHISISDIKYDYDTKESAVISKQDFNQTGKGGNVLPDEKGALFSIIRNKNAFAPDVRDDEKVTDHIFNKDKKTSKNGKQRGRKEKKKIDENCQELAIKKKKKYINDEELLKKERLKKIEYEKIYSDCLINRKNILKKIQNINMKNHLISFDKLFISKIEINEIKLIINIKNQALSYDEKNQNIESDAINALIILIMNIPNISDAHLHFNKEVKKNLCGSLYVLIFDEIMNDYVNSGINQMFYVLGAVDFIGNPLMIYKHWKKGYRNFVKDLRKGVCFLSFPLLFGLHMLNSLGKFGKTIVAGAMEGISRLCGSWSNCFQRFSRNTDNYSIVTNTNLLQYEILDQPSNCAEGFFYGCQSFLIILTISCINIFYKPYIAIRNNIVAKKMERDKVKRFFILMKRIFSGFIRGFFSGCSSFIFGIFNSIFSLFTFLFVGTLNQIQTLTSKSVVRPKKISVIKEYAKIVDYEYAFSFSHQVIKENKSKKELLKKNIIAVILLHTIKDNMSEQVKTFLWISSKELGYCEKNKLMWILSINCIIKIDVTLIQVVNDKTPICRKSSMTPFRKSICKGELKESSNNLEKDKLTEKKQKKITYGPFMKFDWKNLFKPHKFRHFYEFKPSYYIRILHRSPYKVKKKKKYNISRHYNYIMNNKNSYNYKMRKLLRKNTFEKYFEKNFQQEYLIYENKENEETKKLKEILKDKEKKEKNQKLKEHNTNETNKKYRRKINELTSDEEHENDKNIKSNKKENKSINFSKNKNYANKKMIAIQLFSENFERHKKGKNITKVNEHQRKINKSNKILHNRKKFLSYQNNCIYISKLVKCESKEMALHIFSVLMSFLLHKSPYYINKMN